MTYGEGLLVGYRHFDRANEPPLFPFGFGLTYTRFAYSDVEAPEEARVGEPVAVSFTLKNVGERPGKETAQLYVRPRGPSVERPVKELKGFAKVALAPGAVPAGANRPRRAGFRVLRPAEARVGGGSGRLRPADRRFGGRYRAAGHCAAGRVTSERREMNKSAVPTGSAHEI